MRVTAVPSANGLKVRAIAGTYVVLIAFDCDAAYCAGLLGFAIKRTRRSDGQVGWLHGLKQFAPPHQVAPEDLTTLNAPIQKFHWGDYTARAGETYDYEVHALRGAAGALVDSDVVTVTVTCEQPQQVGANGHVVHYNRSAASSQAFANHFPNLPAGEVVDPAARAWLSRGLAEALIGFIDDTAAGEGLHLFVYEFDKPDFAQALQRALVRGVKLEILHDGIIGKDGKGPVLKSGPLLHQYGLDSVSRDRTGAGIAISHNKFMVRTDASGTAVAVWTGSTNFTESGVYAQSNVGHAIHAPEPAATYLKWHQTIWNANTDSVQVSRAAAQHLTSVPAPGTTSGTTLVLSPRATTEAITACADIIGTATDMVCFTAPFALHADLERAMIAAPAQVYGLLNKHGVVTPALYDAPNTSLAAAAALKDTSVLEAWQKQLLAESLHHSGVYIHTKIILVDPLSDHPVVICGSANFSHNSSCNNDENQLFIFDEPEVTDVYIGEFMRMFDHYDFRDHVKAGTSPYLDETDGWAKRYFNGGDREKARTAFF